MKMYEPSVGKRFRLLFGSQSSSVRGLTISCTKIFLRCLSSTVLNSASSISPVQSLTLPNQFVFGLPIARAPAQWAGRKLFPSLSTYLSSSVCVQIMSFSLLIQAGVFLCLATEAPIPLFFLCSQNSQYKSQAFHLKSIYSCLLFFSQGPAITSISTHQLLLTILPLLPLYHDSPTYFSVVWFLHILLLVMVVSLYCILHPWRLMV